MRILLILLAGCSLLAQGWRERLTERFGHPVYAVAETSGGEVWAAGYLLFRPGVNAPLDPFPDAARLGTGGAPNFIVKLNADGGIAWSAYYGSAQQDLPLLIRVDGQGRPLVAGYTAAFDFPATEAHLPRAFANGPYLIRFTADGSAVDYATWLPFSDIADVAIDARDRLWLAGADAYGRAEFPDDAPQPKRAAGNCMMSRTGSLFPCTDAYVAVVALDGTRLEWGTYAGGTGCLSVCLVGDPVGGTFPRGSDAARRLTIDDRGFIYVAGMTTSADFPATTALPETLATSADAFLLVIEPDGYRIVASTVFGSPASDDPDNIFFDEEGHPIVAGRRGRASGINSTSGVSVSATERFTTVVPLSGFGGAPSSPTPRAPLRSSPMTPVPEHTCPDSSPRRA